MTDYNDGKWHGWNGGECPVHPKSVVDMVWPSLFKDSDALRAKRQACEFTWHVSKTSSPFLFRVVKEYREPREFWLYRDSAAERFGVSRSAPTAFWNEVIHVREVTE